MIIVVFVINLNVNITVYFFITVPCYDTVNGFGLNFNIFCWIYSIYCVYSNLIWFWDNMEFFRRLVENWWSRIFILYFFIDQWFINKRFAKFLLSLVIIWKRVIVLVDSLVVSWLSFWVGIRGRWSNHAFSFCFYSIFLGCLDVFHFYVFIDIFLKQTF